MPTCLSVFVWKLLMLGQVYTDNQKDGLTTIVRQTTDAPTHRSSRHFHASPSMQVDIPRLEKDWSKSETELCFSEGLMKAGLASVSYTEPAALDGPEREVLPQVQRLREVFGEGVLRKHWDVLSVAFGMENIKKEDIDEMPKPVLFVRL